MNANMKIRRKLFFLAVGAILLASGAAGAQTAKATGTKPSKLEGMLKEIDAVYQPVKGENAFIVSYSGDDLKDIDLFVFEGEGAIAIMFDIVSAKDVNLTPAIMRKLLEFNANVDFIKVGISPNGSIRVQTEQGLEGMTSKSCKNMLDQMAAGANDIAKILAPARKKTGAK
jgi:hypothetical protein